MSAGPATRRRPASDVPNGLWGLGLFLCTEGAFLLAMVASYFYLDFTSGRWPPPGAPAPPVAAPVALTALLVATIVPVQLAGRAARARSVRPVLVLVTLATLAQGAYLAVQAARFADDLDALPIGASAYAGIHHTLLAAEHAHVAAGLLANAWLLAGVRRGLTPYRVTAVRAVGWYWAFVAAISVLITAAEVSAS